MPVITGIIDQHAEEAAFNWLIRNRAVSEPHYDLKDIAHLDDRVEANIDGLRIAGDEGWEICREAMHFTEDVGEVFTAGVLAFESKKLKRMNAVLSAVKTDNELERALISALGWIRFENITKPVQQLIHASGANLKAIGIATLAIQRRDPGTLINHYIHSEASAVRSRVIKACAELGRRDLLHEILTHLEDEDLKCRFYAALSATILGSPHSVVALRQYADQKGPFAEEAALTAIRRMHPAEAHEWLRHMGRKANQIRLAIKASGALGDPAVMPSLLKAMRVPEFARPAGEAFSMITGVDIAYHDLECEWPEGFEAGPTENPDDEDVEMDPDEDLPWPDHDLIHKWWNENKRNFRNGTRYLCGKPISVNQCQHVLRHGYQRQRQAAALELSMMKPGLPLFPTKAPGFRQQRLLGLK